MKKQKRGSIICFLFSFLPGAAEMYMGFMKMGISLMGAFFLILGVSFILNIEEVLVYLAAVLWFYAFFHARNMSSLSQEELENIPDEYLIISANGMDGSGLIRKYRNWIAGILIFLGVYLLWNVMKEIVFGLIPEYFRVDDAFFQYMHSIEYIVSKFVIGIFIILAGIRLLKGKKNELEVIECKNEKSEQ